MKHRKAFAVLLGALTLAGPAFADTDGTVETVHVRVGHTEDYDEFWLTGNLHVCPSLDGNWRYRVRVLRSDSGHDAALRLLTAAKLSGNPVRVTAVTDVVPGRCVLRNIRML